MSMTLDGIGEKLELVVEAVSDIREELKSLRKDQVEQLVEVALLQKEAEHSKEQVLLLWEKLGVQKEKHETEIADLKKTHEEAIKGIRENEIEPLKTKVWRIIIWATGFSVLAGGGSGLVANLLQHAGP